ncbi:MAG: hypothetical protein ACYDCO_21670 [Armatimonadota bacterium]
MASSSMLDIASRLELFVDDALIASLGGRASRRLHRPVAREAALVTDRPWEGNMCGYVTCFRDGDRFRMYYKAWRVVLSDASQGERLYSPHGIMIGCAESDDGITWRRPSLGLVAFEGSTDNNLVFTGIGELQKGVHGFAPFKDANPGCPPEARYKALGADEERWPNRKLYALQSPDGLRWSLMREEPLAIRGAFDSQNLAFWDAVRGEYRAYVRDKNGGRGIRTCTSRDFLDWTPAEWLDYGDAPAEQLYTSQVLPYERAPHIFLGFPTRYVERPWSAAIEALPELEHRRRRAGVNERFGTSLTDGQFMASRDGCAFTRWDETFIPPGLRAQGSWTYGDCYQAWGLLQTPSHLPGAPDELSMFASEGCWRGEGVTLRRYTLRVDGFVSVHAPMGGGELFTPPFTFAGDRLLLNIATAAGGSARVELQSPDGRPLDGFTLDDCVEIIGDTLEYPVRWRGTPRLRALSGHPLRLRVVLHDADLYSFRFTADPDV